MTRTSSFRNTLLTCTLLLAGAVALAADSGEVASGIVVSTAADTIVLDTPAGRDTFSLAPEAALTADLAPGDTVLVRLDGDGRAADVLLVEDRVEVTAPLDRETERAVLGTVSATSPQQLLVRTTTGEQAFVVDPEKLFPPLPAPDRKVAVTYRTLDLHPPRHLATGLVVLPDDFRLASGAVRVTSEPAVVAQAPAPAPEPLPERLEEERPALPTPARMIEPVNEPIEPLPQTATRLPVVLSAGALLLGLGIAARHDQ
ncbi:MAG: hypothetical protein R2991_11790 [Thermoanaerobaculia bacterium]